MLSFLLQRSHFGKDFYLTSADYKNRNGVQRRDIFVKALQRSQELRFLIHYVCGDSAKTPWVFFVSCRKTFLFAPDICIRKRFLSILVYVSVCSIIAEYSNRIFVLIILVLLSSAWIIPFSVWLVENWADSFYFNRYLLESNNVFWSKFFSNIKNKNNCIELQAHLNSWMISEVSEVRVE